MPNLDERSRTAATLALRAQFEPIVKSILCNTTELAYTQAAEAAERTNVYELPYGREYINFSYNLFQNRDIPSAQAEDQTNEDYYRALDWVVRQQHSLTSYK